MEERVKAIIMFLLALLSLIGSTLELRAENYAIASGLLILGMLFGFGMVYFAWRFLKSSS